MAFVSVRKRFFDPNKSSYETEETPLYFICSVCLSKFENFWPLQKDANIGDNGDNQSFFNFCPFCGEKAYEHFDKEERILFFTFDVKKYAIGDPNEYAVGNETKHDSYFDEFWQRDDLPKETHSFRITKIKSKKHIIIREDGKDREMELFEVVGKPIRKLSTKGL